MSLDNVVKIDMDKIGIPTYHLYDELFKIGVTQVTENWHDFLTIELILEGDFKDEDIAQAFFQHSPMMYRHVGQITSTVRDIHGMMHSYGFTRG